MIKLLSLLILPLTAHSYENMLIKGYKSCIACHQSSTGGGLLTAYGKYIASTSSIIKSKLNPSDNSNLSHAFQGRYAQIDANGAIRRFPMQVDYLVSYNIAKNFKISSVLARAPKSQAISSGIEKPSTTDLLFFRKAIIEYKQLYFGRERFNLGLNLIDHTIVTKSLNRMNISDSISSIGYRQQKDKYYSDLKLFFPSFQENSKNKESGISYDLRYFFKEYIIGGFLYSTKGESIDRKSIGINLKKSFSNFMIMAEGSYSNRELNDQRSLDQRTFFTRLSYIPILQLTVFLQHEKAIRNKDYLLDESRLGLGIRTKIHKNLSTQIDIKKTNRNEVDEKLTIAQLFLNIW